MAEAERLYSVEEIANHIGVSKDTIRAWIKKETKERSRMSGTFFVYKVS